MSRETVVSIGLPLFRPGTSQVRYPEQEEGLERYLVAEIEVKDEISGATSSSAMQIAKPTVRLLTDRTEAGRVFPPGDCTGCGAPP